MKRRIVSIILLGLQAVLSGAQRIDSEADNEQSIQPYHLPSSPFQHEEDGRLRASSRGVITKQEGSYSAHSSGGRTVIVRSSSTGRSRIFSAKTVKGRREPVLLGTYKIGDLHTAYRLPLQRLSNNQLMLLIRRYSSQQNGQLSEGKKALIEKNEDSHSQLSRPEMINRLQHLMLTRNQGLRLIRPTLLTNINVLPDEVVIEEKKTPLSTQIPLSPESLQASNNRGLGSSNLVAEDGTDKHTPTSLSSVEDIPLDSVQQHKKSLGEQHVAPEAAGGVEGKLSESSQALKAKYEQLRVEFLEKLNLLNSLKMQLLAKKRVGTTEKIVETTAFVTTPNPPTSQQMKDEETNVEMLQTNMPSLSTEPTAFTQEKSLLTSREEYASTTQLPLYPTNQMEVSIASSDVEQEDISFSSTQEIENFTSASSLTAESTSPVFTTTEQNIMVETNAASTDPNTSDSSTIGSSETFSLSSTTETTQEEETTAFPAAPSSTPLRSVENEPIEETSTLISASTQDHNLPTNSSKKLWGSRLIKKLMGILQAKLHQKAMGNTEEDRRANLDRAAPPVQFSSTSVKVANPGEEDNARIVNTGQLVENHEEQLEKPRLETLTVEKTVKSPIPRAHPAPRIFSSTNVALVSNFTTSPGEEGSLKDGSIHMQSPPARKEEEIVERAEIIDDGESTGNSANEAAASKFALNRVGDVSAAELAHDLKGELESRRANGSGLEEQRPKSTQITKSKEELDPKGLEEFAEANDEESICDAIACDFEEGNLCQWEASRDELQKGDRRYFYNFLYKRLRRSELRENDSPVIRTWHNWEGRYRNRLTGIARAQYFSHFNRRFAAAYVQSNQKAILTAKILSGQRETVYFRAWEATRDVQLRVCCDTNKYCVFETERGVRRGSRRWKEHTATCPKGTQKIMFECVNDGVYQGACGLDNIQLLNQYCPNLIPSVGVHENRRH